MPSFDSFGFNGETSNVDVKPTDDVTDLDTGKTGQLDANGNAVDDITGNGNGDGNNGDANKDKQTPSSTGGITCLTVFSLEAAGAFSPALLASPTLLKSIS